MRAHFQGWKTFRFILPFWKSEHKTYEPNEFLWCIVLSCALFIHLQYISYYWHIGSYKSDSLLFNHKMLEDREDFVHKQATPPLSISCSIVMAIFVTENNSHSQQWWKIHYCLTANWIWSCELQPRGRWKHCVLICYCHYKCIRSHHRQHRTK